MPFQKIIWIDDDTEDLEIFREAVGLISERSKCIIFMDARDALDKLREKKLVPDVIFVDLNISMMSGQEFLAQLSDQRQCTRTLFS